MAGTQNFFALLDDDENEDVQALATRIAPPVVKAAPVVVKAPAPEPPAVKEAPPANAVASARGRGAYNRDSRGGDRSNFRNRSYGQSAPDGEANGVVEKERSHADRGHGRDRGHRGGRGNFHRGEGGEERRPRRDFERHSGTGRGTEMKRNGAGAANWGVEGEIPLPEPPAKEDLEDKVDLENEPEKAAEVAEVKEGEEVKAEEDKKEEKEEEKEEDKEMTLKEFEALREEKRKAALLLNAAEQKEVRVVEVKEFETMHKVSKTAEEELVLFKLGPEKEKAGKKRGDEEDRPKTVNLNEFLKPAEGEAYVPPRRSTRGGDRGDRGDRREHAGERRGGGDRRGRGPRGGGQGSAYVRKEQPIRSSVSQINTADTAQFPSLA